MALADEKLDALIVQLQQKLAQKREEDELKKLQAPLPDAPPFEEPCIVDIFRFYVMHAYGEQQLAAEQRQRLNELCNFLLAVLDANFLANVPQALREDPAFVPLYERWAKFCFRTPDTKDEPAHRMTRAFGRQMLLQVAPLLMATVRNEAIYISLPDPLKSFAPKFLEALLQEVRNSRSVIFRKDVLEVLAQRRAHTSGRTDTLNLNLTPSAARKLLPNEFNHAGTTVSTSTAGAPPSSSSSTSATAPASNRLAPQQLFGSSDTHNVNVSNKRETVPRGASHGGAMQSGDDARAHKRLRGDVRDETMPTASTSTLAPGAAGPGYAIDASTGHPLLELVPLEPLVEKPVPPSEYPEGISFLVVANDGRPESLMRLTDLKQIFHKQLPKMPTTYIARLVFDTEHMSLVCMLDGRSIGGITFRPFKEERFVEITFCAVTTDRQVKGFGSLIMTHLKAYCQGEGYLDLLTYADSFAVGYFSKQGFRARVTLPREVWAGRIKDYEGATLMHCVVHPTLDYTKLSQLLVHAREVTGQHISALDGSARVYKGLAHFKGKKAKKDRIDIADIPGVLEAGWTPGQGGQEAGEADRLFDELDSLLQSIKRHSYAWPFKEAVDRQAVPQYYKIITDPIDLSMIEEKLKSRTYYINRDLFVADLRRMLQNCKTFNASDTSYHKCAVHLEAFLDERLKKMEQRAT